jgi:dipicolinate synthase subunit B
MKKLRVGLALCGSYCTYDKIMESVPRLAEIYDLTPIMSETAANTDSRFGKASDFIAKLEEITGKPVITSIVEAEPIGPQGLLDVLVIAPCTGNTIAKIASGITDSCVTMACKAHLRNNRPVVLAISTNDGLSGNAANIGTLLSRKNIYFVPFYQDDPVKKPNSLMADFDLIEATIESAMEGRQLQPLFLAR